MHILTKVFIVFAAVLSLVLSVLTIAFAFNADSINSRYADALLAAEAADAVRQADGAAYSEANTRLQGQIDQLQAQLAAIESTNADLALHNAGLTSEVQRAEQRASAIENQIGASLETTAAQASVIGSLREDNTSLRDSELALRRQNLELEDRVNDQASQIQVYQASIRALREQLAAAQSDAERRFGSAGSMGVLGADAPFEAAGPVIRGRVTRVSSDSSSGEPLIEVDIGSNDRVSENMKLHVGRGDSQFVATLVVIKTDLQSSVARVALTNSGAAVREGDMVVSRFLN